MENTTLEKMQEIEQAAEEVLSEYDNQITMIRDQQEEKLKSLSLAYDQETTITVQSLIEKKKKEIEGLEQDVAVTIQKNQEKVEAALTDKKADLVQAIVDKVVKRYGHEYNAAFVFDFTKRAVGYASFLSTGSTNSTAERFTSRKRLAVGF